MCTVVFPRVVLTDEGIMEIDIFRMCDSTLYVGLTAAFRTLTYIHYGRQNF